MVGSEKLEICRVCKFHKEVNLLGKTLVTCGTLDLLRIPPIIGEEVEHEGNRVKLCGCVMNIKTITGLSCPIDRW